MFSFIKRIPYWYLVAVPLLLMGLGAASNQAVLIANNDKFPVMANEEKLQHMCQDNAASTNKIAEIVKALSGHDAPAPVKIDPYTCENGGEFMDDTHVIMTSKSHLRFLADVFDMHDAIYSIGDFSLILGQWMWSWALISWLTLAVRQVVEKP